MLEPMRRISLLLLIIILGFAKNVCAQADTIVSYMKIDYSSGFSDGVIPVTDTAGADFLRKVMTPNALAGEKVNQVRDYYLNGKLKLKGGTTSNTIHILLDGWVAEYYPNGHTKRTATYQAGKPIGNSIEYYANGRLYLSGDYDDAGVFKVDSCNDLEGKMIAEKGNGRLVFYNDDFKAVNEGPILNGEKNGLWKGTLTDSITYEIQYNAGVVVSGTSYDKKGNKYPFTEIEVIPGFTGGIEAFGKYLSRNIRYPEYARKHQIQGRVIVTFVVERDGSLSDIRVTRGLDAGELDNEAVRVIKMSPRWKPGMRYGIPLRTQYTVPVSFTLADR
jgi:TonB family protein